jgi:sodium transport system permease protein
VATMSFVAGCLNVIAMMFTMRSNLALLGGPSGLTFRVPLASVPVMLIGAALLALFIAAGMLILASFARTFKEGQSLVSPFMIAFILPLVFIQSPAQEFTMKIAFVPVVNVAMMFRQAIVGSFNWQPMLITLGVEVLCVTAALKLATTVVEKEGFMMDSSGGAFQSLRRYWTRRTNGGRPVAG